MEMRVLKWTGGVLLVLVLALVLFVVFGLGTLRGPIERGVSSATGRELLIQGRLKPVWSWVHPRFRAEKVSFANPEWASEDFMFQADAVEASIEVLPLFIGRVVVPEVHLERPVVNLEIDDEGRKNWILDSDQKKEGPSRVHIKLLTLDRGELKYDDALREISIDAALAMTSDGVTVDAKGKYHGLDASLQGRGGQVLALKDTDVPYALDATAMIGATGLKAKGTVTNVAELSAADLAVELRGKTLAELYDVIGIALPETGPYTTRGRLVRSGRKIRYENFTGKVGESDIAGTLEVDTGGKRAFMGGELTSKVLNLADLGVIVGTDQPKESGVLPDMPFDPERWESIDADVRIKAGSIQGPKTLPLENLAAHIVMRDKVMSLEPLAFGIVGGEIAGTVRLDGRQRPIDASANLRVTKLALAQLFPTIKENQGSSGEINGLVEIAGRGDSVGRMLANANGKLGLYLDGGDISRFMMELVALDLWGAARVKLSGDDPVPIRCALADFAVKDGVMNTNAFVFDTQVVNVAGEGTVNLKTEAIDLKLKPQPKDRSPISLNSPLYVRGTFGAPKVAPDTKRLAAKGVGALVMGIINPLLAVLPLVKDKEKADSPCAQLIAEATKATKAPKAKQQAAAARAKEEKAAAGATSSGRPAPSDAR